MNSARLISWVVIHATVYPEWKERMLKEMRNFLEKYDVTPESLDRIPFHAWDTDLPLLDMTADEILRSHGYGVLLRQNVGEAIEINGYQIPKGGCVIYPMSDAHQNPKFYGPTPNDFEPGRIERMESEKSMNFVAWGRGKSSQTRLRCVLRIG
jgi:cytochrome P450